MLMEACICLDFYLSHICARFWYLTTELDSHYNFSSMHTRISSTQYLPLQTTESDTLLYEDVSSSESKELLIGAPEARPSKLERRGWQLVIVASIAALCSSIWNVAIMNALKAESSSQSSFTPKAQLFRPNPYIGLEMASIKPSSPRPEPILNPPILMARTNSSDVDRVYLDIPKVDTRYGQVYPEDRDFHITKEVSMILQFRVMDYGMERCTLIAKLPSSAELDHSEYPRFYDIHPNGLHVDIWELDSSLQLDAKTLSFASRPRRQALDGTWKVEMGRDMRLTETRNCSSRSLLTYELVCASMEYCQLYFKQDGHTPVIGVYVEQSSSI
ncbi:hypothetical protein D9758_008992 [Tetrapyrgos nigripes]|uniref:Ubiquitin 3 binding protein But2 C-terminal domain-containing protein n=1 Tax=Tetrapyrgos nigripes TaxID=182062 RepID=A0A8H5GKS7_9AGAR|nr:hypothetical protein D9758_008992 [Tetrapyrgos nigripes]